jgi:acetylornithine aminotransferase
MGSLIRALLRESLAGIPAVRDIRGKGLMVGIELDRPCGELVDLARADGLLINVTADTVVRLLPPLIIQPAEVHTLIEGVCGLLHAFVGEPVGVAG